MLSKFPKIGVARAASGNAFLLFLLRLPPMYQIPLLTDCFVILRSCRLHVKCYMFYDVMLNRLVVPSINIHRVNNPISLI